MKLLGDLRIYFLSSTRHACVHLGPAVCRCFNLYHATFVDMLSFYFFLAVSVHFTFWMPYNAYFACYSLAALIYFWKSAFRTSVWRGYPTVIERPIFNLLTIKDSNGKKKLLNWTTRRRHRATDRIAHPPSLALGLPLRACNIICHRYHLRSFAFPSLCWAAHHEDIKQQYLYRPFVAPSTNSSHQTNSKTCESSTGGHESSNGGHPFRVLDAQSFFERPFWLSQSVHSRLWWRYRWEWRL
jgi:hypothetical protein